MFSRARPRKVQALRQGWTHVCSGLIVSCQHRYQNNRSSSINCNAKLLCMTFGGHFCALRLLEEVITCSCLPSGWTLLMCFRWVKHALAKTQNNIFAFSSVFVRGCHGEKKSKKLHFTQASPVKFLSFFKNTSQSMMSLFLNTTNPKRRTFFLNSDDRPKKES